MKETRKREKTTLDKSPKLTCSYCKQVGYINPNPAKKKTTQIPKPVALEDEVVGVLVGSLID